MTVQCPCSDFITYLQQREEIAAGPVAQNCTRKVDGEREYNNGHRSKNVLDRLASLLRQSGRICSDQNCNVQSGTGNERQQVKLIGHCQIGEPKQSAVSHRFNRRVCHLTQSHEKRNEKRSLCQWHQHAFERTEILLLHECVHLLGETGRFEMISHLSCFGHFQLDRLHLWHIVAHFGSISLCQNYQRKEQRTHNYCSTYNNTPPWNIERNMEVFQCSGI